MRRSFVFDICVFTGLIAVIGYFSWAGFMGPRSYVHEAQMAKQVAAIKTELKAIQDKRLVQDRRVGLLRPATIDPDMLDEMARSQLGFAYKSDLIIAETSN